MALWVALLAVDTLFYAGITLAYKLGLFAEHFPYPRNVPSLEATPLWDPMLTLLAGAAFIWAIVLILRRSRLALQAVVAPFVVSLLLFAIRLVRPESGDWEALSVAYQKSHYALMWPIAGLTFTILICLALWHDRQTSAPR
jgi:phosphoglycerol transferase MdoB-like AlkP superfamily enzyme